MAVELEKYKGGGTRHTCPGCGHKRQFTRYVVVESGEYIADHVGKCNRENNCGYHYTPKQFYQDNPGTYKPEHYQLPTVPVREKVTTFIPHDFLVKSCDTSYYEKNNLFKWFSSVFGREQSEAVFLKYLVGTSLRSMPGAAAFWQIDCDLNVRQCKVMQYDPMTGKRRKDLDACFIGKRLMGHEAHFKQCFFGEALLKEHPLSTVAIVESEKTALICDLFYPGMVWLATGGMYGCSWKNDVANVCKSLTNRKVVLFPDLNATEKWKEIANIIRDEIECRITVSEDLENIASHEEKMQGLDIADYLLKSMKHESKPERAEAA